jgi:hypothetical protein
LISLIIVETLESRNMALSGKVFTEIEIRALPAKVYNIFRKQLKQIPEISPDQVQGARLHEGDWENVGSVIHWEYTIGN